MRFPRLVIPLSVTLGALFELGMTLVAVVIFLVDLGRLPDLGLAPADPADRHPDRCSPPASALLLSVLFVRFRDIRPIWDVVGQMLFYASPVLYVSTMVPEEYQHPYLANPLATVLTADAPRGDRPGGADGRRGDRRVRAAADPGSRSSSASFALGVWAFNARGAARRGEPVTELTVDERAELEALRARVGELERERAEQIARANAAVAARRSASTGSTAGTSTSTR